MIFYILKKIHQKIGNSITSIKELILVTRDFILFLLYKSKSVNLSKISSNIIVLGNGPSLSELDLSLIKNHSDFKFFVCNGFATSIYFEVLKPSHYFIKDPLYFDLLNPFVTNRENDVLNTWEKISSLTTWEMTIFTALMDIDSINNIKEKFPFNASIKWVNILPIEFKGKYKFKYISKGIGLIGGMTVTHFSTLIAILSSSNSVKLAGVDHDWVSCIEYDNSSHKLYLNNNHFYGNGKIFYGEGIYENNDIVVELYSQYKSFKGFKELSQFASYLKVSLSRCTKSYLHFINYKPLSLHQ
jgi:hypothetical protein